MSHILVVKKNLLHTSSTSNHVLNDDDDDDDDERKKVEREVANFEFEEDVAATRQNSSRRMKAIVFRFLESKKCSVRSTYYDRLIVLLIVGSLGLAIANSVKGFQRGWVDASRLVLETLLLLIFLTEYILRIWSSGVHGTYGASGGWKKYLLTPHMIIDLLVIFSSLGLVISSQLPMNPKQERLLHLLQLLRVLRIDRQRGAFRAFWKVFRKHRKELLTCWYMGFLMVTFVSFLVYALESKAGREKYTYDDLFNTVYWGVVSLTTIGYGDISPKTTSGKILICCFAVFGTCFLAMPAGIIGSGFALQVAEQQKEKHVNRRRRPAAVLIQSFWRKYAADNNYEATWLPHIKGREEKFNKRTREKTDMFGVPFAPILSNISKNNNGFAEKKEKEIDDLQESINGKALWYPRKTLTSAEKIALRFVRLLKCISSLKKFRQARRPYDERDVLDQFASSQVEMFAKLRDVREKFEGCLQITNNKAAENTAQVSHLRREIELLKLEAAETNKLMRQLLHQRSISIKPSNEVDV